MTIQNLIDHDDISSYTELTYTDAQKAEIRRICHSVESLFYKLTGRQYYNDEKQTHTEYYTPEVSTNTFYLNSTPAISIIGVYLYSTNSNEYVAYTGDKYLVKGMKVVLSDYLESLVPNYVKIQVKGAVVPPDVKNMLIEWVILILNNKTDAGQMKKSASVSDQKRDYLIVDNLPANLKNVIDAYRIPNV